MSVERQLYHTHQIRELEQLARERLGFSDEELMLRAGNAAWHKFMEYWPEAKQLTILCGSGNNGGDGYVLARLAHQAGKHVRVWQTNGAPKSASTAHIAYLAAKENGVLIEAYPACPAWHSAEVIIDAIFGTGFRGELSPGIKSLIQAVNNSELPVFALDLPTGVDADTGAVPEIAIKATATVTFIGLKMGLLTGKGIAYAGRVSLQTLQLPSEFYQMIKGVAEKATLSQFSSWLAQRPRDWHKGNAGHVLIIGGEGGFSGAPRLAAEAALRVGAGLVSVATHPQHAAFMNIACPELMCHSVTSASQLHILINKAKVIALGPGLGQSAWARKLFNAALQSARPVVVDADALNLLSVTKLARSNWILTPHPGEAARLLKTTPEDIQNNRLAALKKLQQTYNGICILKGAGSMIADTASRIKLCDKGNPGMATAGMGDVLTGVIAGLIAQGIPPVEAAPLAVCLHAEAGDLASQLGERGMIASDVLAYLRKLANLH